MESRTPLGVTDDDELPATPAPTPTPRPPAAVTATPAAVASTPATPLPSSSAPTPATSSAPAIPLASSSAPTPAAPIIPPLITSTPQRSVARATPLATSTPRHPSHPVAPPLATSTALASSTSLASSSTSLAPAAPVSTPPRRSTPASLALDETRAPSRSARPPELEETRHTAVGSLEGTRGGPGLETTDASGHTPLAHDEPVPRQIGRFAVLRRLGRGGMGTVYAAFDEHLARRVALKVLHTAGYDGTDGRAHLVAEAQAMARLSHPNVVQVYELDAHAGEVVLVMEFVEGQTLGPWLADRALDWVGVVRTLLAAGRGLAAAHEAGLVHRDFKPDNVLVGADGVPRVADFGLARAAADTVAQFAGTPAYMAPEQHLGARADARSDQYSFCVTLYEALYGPRPHVGDTYEQLASSVLDGVLPPQPGEPKVPAPLHAVISRGLALAPADRWPTMDALLVALAEQLPHDRPRRWPARVGLVALAAAVVALVALLNAPEPGASPADLAQIAALDTDARTFAADARWVYPGETTPQRDTAIVRLLALEDVPEPAASFARHHAGELRQHHAAELARLGDAYWDDRKTRPFARDFYAQALIFTPDHATAIRRGALTAGQLAELRAQAIAADFSPEQLAAAAPLRILADLDDPDRFDKLAALTPACPDVPTAPAGSPGVPADAEPPPEPAPEPAPEPEPDAFVGPMPLPTSAAKPEVDVSEILEQAENARRRGHDAESARLFRQVLAASPRDSTALAGLSDIAFDDGAFDDAARLAERAARLAPDIAEHHTRLGDAYLKLGRPADARDRYQRAIALGDPRAKRRLDLLPPAP